MTNSIFNFNNQLHVQCKWTVCGFQSVFNYSLWNNTLIFTVIQMQHLNQMLHISYKIKFLITHIFESLLDLHNCVFCSINFYNLSNLQTACLFYIFDQLFNPNLSVLIKYNNSIGLRGDHKHDLDYVYGTLLHLGAP